MSCAFSLPGYDAWKTYDPDDYDDYDFDRMEEEEADFLEQLEDMAAAQPEDTQ